MGFRFWATLLLFAGLGRATETVRYNDAGELIRPADYREWIYLTSGVGMTYGPAGQMARDMPPFFDNVFVPRDAYRAFVETGRWPDKTILILEVRYSQGHGSINKGGHFQTDIAAVEAAVKDEERFPDKWAYFAFPTRGGEAAAATKPLPKSAGCWGCHSANGAVENTFVQFYPTLLAVAEQKRTVKASFKPWTPSPARLYHTAASDGWPAAEIELNRARTEESDAMILHEPALNRLGYQLLEAGKKAEAVATLKYARALYPKSANLADSLAEIYEAGGQKPEAIEAARQTLALLDSDSALSADAKARLAKNVRERLARLGAGQ